MRIDMHRVTLQLTDASRSLTRINNTTVPGSVADWNKCALCKLAAPSHNALRCHYRGASNYILLQQTAATATDADAAQRLLLLLLLAGSLSFVLPSVS